MSRFPITIAPQPRLHGNVGKTPTKSCFRYRLLFLLAYLGMAAVFFTFCAPLAHAVGGSRGIDGMNAELSVSGHVNGHVNGHATGLSAGGRNGR